MTTGTVLLLILSIAIAAALSFFQYFFRGNRSKVALWLSILRFISIFGLLLLLINPVVSRKSYETEKAPLPVVLDNSASISELGASGAASKAFSELTTNRALAEKFDIQPYQFDAEFSPAGNQDYKGRQSNIAEVAKNLQSINKNKLYPSIILTDGNQTSGNDFVYAFDQSNKVYPVILGDTTTFLDLRVSRLNVNKYAFLKNKFPAEVFLQYSGNKTITADFAISRGKNVVTRQQVNFSPSNRSAVINVLLPADSPGLQIFRASVTSREAEKNTFNNYRNFAVEVIDQKTGVAIISSLNHPDLGALKRSIETNAQRKVTIVKPSDLKSFDDYNILIIYQPDSSFRNIYERAANAGINTWTITGTSTDFSMLNRAQDQLSFRMSGQSEDYLPEFNDQFNFFAAEDIGFSNLPPLQHSFGNVTVNANVNTLLSSNIRNISANQPMLAFVENARKRTAFLLGENIWKWRIQSHLDNRSFEKFDQFIDRIIQFLASDNKRKSLVVNHESFYNSGDQIEIGAQFFNKNYEFDERARLTVSVVNKDTKQSKRYDMLKSGNTFKVNLDGLAAGRYDFSVRELNSNTTYNGYFEILDFDIEKQFVNPDVARLNQMASQTNGKSFLPAQVDELVKILLADENYKPVEKTITKRTPIIDWIWLLIIITLSLAIEWFVRKYNGML